MTARGRQIISNQIAARALFAAGAIGSSIVSAADMVLIGLPIGGSEAQTLGLGLLEGKSPSQLRLGAFGALPGFFLQALGFMGFVVIAQAGRLGRQIIVALGFGLTLFVGAAWHMLYLPLATAINIGTQSNEALQAALVGDLVFAFHLWRWLFIGSNGLLALLIVTRSVAMPVWMVAASPYLLMEGARFAATALPAPVGGMAFVATVNIALFIFFVLSFLTQTAQTTPRART
ncbi:MAG: hypothetical protein AAGH41_08850 [Pseudomonadota bacterium]